MTSAAGDARRSALGQHPVDLLIRELLRTGRPAATEEIAQIIDRMATALFNPQDRRVPTKERGARYRGYTLGARADSLPIISSSAWLLNEGQWANGTTTERYLEDLRRAVRAPESRLVIYERQGGLIATTVTPTERVLPPEWRGRRPQPSLMVIYLADQGIILPGYQFSTLERTSVPKEARWLR